MRFKRKIAASPNDKPFNERAWFGINRYLSDDVDCRNAWNKKKCFAVKELVAVFHIHMQTYRSLSSHKHHPSDEDWSKEKERKARENREAIHKQRETLWSVIPDPSFEFSPRIAKEVALAQQFAKYGNYSEAEWQYFLEFELNNKVYSTLNTKLCKQFLSSWRRLLP